MSAIRDLAEKLSDGVPRPWLGFVAFFGGAAFAGSIAGKSLAAALIALVLATSAIYIDYVKV